MFFVLASKLPVTNGENLVAKNQTTLGIAVTFYSMIGYLIYSGKIEEWLSFIPDRKYLIGIVILDFLLYVALHWFEHGVLPSFVSSNETQVISKKRHEASSKNTASDQAVNNSKQTDQTKRQTHRQIDDQPDERRRQTGAGRSKPRQIQDELPDDIDSALKGPPTEIDEDVEDVMIDDESIPQEASTRGKNFFPKDDKTMVENWDLDEFTHEDCVSSDDGVDEQTDEVFLEK